MFNKQSGLAKKASRDGSKRSMTGNQKIIDVKLEKVELHQTENAWKPNTLKDVENVEMVSRVAQ